MNVPSFEFLGFAALAALIFNISRAPGWRQLVLLLSNLLFFASQMHGLMSALPFTLFVLLGFVMLRLPKSSDSGRNSTLTLLVAFTLFLFIWLKKYTLLPGAMWLPFPYAVIGLSYVFFRVLHLIIDVHSGALPERIGAVSYINYTLNFTSLISGPIQRYQDYRAQAEETPPARPGLIVAGNAMERIIMGFFKVFVLSAVLHNWQLQALAALPDASGVWDRIELGIAIAAIYPFFLYCNFSGYTDTVIGVGLFFGLKLPENFDYPFMAENFIQFWSRWHITLSSWLKTYVYNSLLIKLMGRFPSRAVEPFLGVIAFFVTFFLVGIWHGRTSEFVMFGFLQGGGVAANKLFQIEMVRRLGKKRYKALCANPLYEAITRGLTFTWFTFTLFWFWSNWPQMASIVSALGLSSILLSWCIFFIAAGIILDVAKRLGIAVLAVRMGCAPFIRSRYIRTVYYTILAALTTGIILLSQSPAPDIVYKSF